MIRRALGQLIGICAVFVVTLLVPVWVQASCCQCEGPATGPCPQTGQCFSGQEHFAIHCGGKCDDACSIHAEINGTCGEGTFTTCTAIDPRPNGSACATPSECSSGNCVDGICCNTACSGAGQQCSTGICAPLSIAPAMTPLGLLVTAALLVGIAAIAMRGRRA